ncbi:helix-turn-helix transcriptional regulator [Rhodococcus wratislaviensis]|uniref:Putative LuxR family transcriptional regulator n=1 Tax=Rhodococcus wratislaviensis NBRC 100605 TaxID=1219028 RepID=X0Q708_RHOWR|nr:LuxR family transcriptional regulator [Rhodococcus wratislaviensis]GAF46476.1 putative LuxR family transcriptional regulator [Rhodococcus wratislaviensis NBRC 100605]
MVSTADRWPLVGREEELHLINATITGTGGQGGIVIAGPAGVGKSRLAREAISHVRPGRWIPRWARATASARVLPLGAFAEWVTDTPSDPLLVVRGVIDNLITAPNAAKIAVGVDDAHLLDDQSAFVVLQLAQRRLAPVVVTVRTGEPAPDAVTALWKDEHLQRVELQPLSEDETTQVVTAVLGGRLETAAAHRLWSLTRGNTLYLRHLLEQELASGRLTRNRAIWEWTGNPTISAGLADLISTQIGTLPADVGAVVDALAAAEPLTEQMLVDLTSADAVQAAHSAGLITIDGSVQHAARLAHPMYGEARRAETTPLRLRRLRGHIATALASAPDSGPRDLVRRAVLTLESNLTPDPTLLTNAAVAAWSSLDLDLAERLAHAAIAGGAGYEATFLRGGALGALGRIDEAVDLLAQLTVEDLTDDQVLDVAALRASNFVILNRSEEVGLVLLEASAATPTNLHGSLIACRALVHAFEGRPRDAVVAAQRALQSPNLTNVCELLALASLVVALGDLGKADQIAPIADRGYGAAHSALLAFYRVILCDCHTRSLRLAGYVSEANAVATQTFDAVADVPGWVHVMSDLLMGQAALAAGRLNEARRHLEQTLSPAPKFLGYGGVAWLCALVQVRAMSGDHAAAVTILQHLDSLSRMGFAYLTPEYHATRAWVAAAGGALTQAIEHAHQGAEHARAHHQYAQEVMCLHTATRLGDTTTAHRLRELAEQVDGPRAPAAARHATALAAADPDGLLDASHQFENMGDPLAAMDAAAHAATTHRHHGHNGSALTAAARAQHLADTCGGASTPALREAQQPSPLTARQREIITLAAQGLTNKQIAERMTLSVRTIEGHLHRAALKTGVSSRDDLGTLVTGHQRPHDHGHQLE